MTSLNLSKKPLNLHDFAILALTLILLGVPALAQSIITSFIAVFYRNIDILLWVNITESFWWLNLIPKAIGIAIMGFVVLRLIYSRVQLSTSRIRRQLVKFSTAGLLVLVLMGLVVFVDFPVSQAMTTATTGYVLDTPVSEYDFLIGNYSNHNIYAIDGSTWDNLMGGVGSSVWEAYTGNHTKVEELVLSSITDGSVLCKNVVFDISLISHIPENVRVDVDYYGTLYSYVNPLSSQRDFYTISVGSDVNYGYYVAKDSEGRICFASQDCSQVFQTCLNIGSGTVAFQSGQTFEFTSQIKAVSNVDVEGNDATLTFSGNNYYDALLFNSTTNTHWRNLNVIRSGANASTLPLFNGMSAVWVTWYTDESTVFTNCNFTANVDNTGFNNANAGRFNEYCKPTLYRCSFYGGFGNIASAAYIWDFSRAVFNDCKFYGRASSSMSCGLEIEGGSQPVFNGGYSEGGFGGSAFGVRVYNSACPQFNSVEIHGGETGTYCFAVDLSGVCIPTFTNCRIFNARNTGGTAVRIQQAAAPIFNGGVIQQNTTSWRWAYTSAENGRLRPFAGYAYTLLNIEILVNAGTPGAYIDIGTTVGGNQIANDVPIDSVGYKLFTFNPAELAQNSYIYITPNTPVPYGSFFVYYNVIPNTGNCYALDMDSRGALRMDGVTMISNRASDTIKLRDNALANLNWNIVNCRIETLDTLGQYAVSATTNTNNIPIYNCLIKTNVQNVTFASGTALGTNWQP